MTTDLADAVCVVTGATRGIGRHVAHALGERGAHVVVVGRTSRGAPHASLPGSVDDTVDELAARGVRAHGIRADLTDPDATQTIVDATLATFGRCDVVVNNAAYTSNGPMLEVPWRRWERAFRVQVTAPLQLAQGFLPGMIDRGRGTILNVSSGASQRLTPGLALYGTSKLAMERWSDFLALEVSEHPVAVNTLRVDRIVTTEGWQYVADTQGIDVATGGAGLDAVMAPEQAAEHVVWMLRRPPSWTGRTVGFEDITALGGPATPTVEVAT